MWLLALRCCAALKWDLTLIGKFGNVLTLRSLFERLLKWAFPEWQSEDILTNLLTICSMVDSSSMSEGGRFAAWLYARWVVGVDIAARFPDPLPRATVSNPQGQVDPNLAQAEALKTTTANIRTLTESSICILRRFTSDTSFFRLGLKIPLKECFESMTEDPPLQPVFVSSKQTIPSPRFDRSVADVSPEALLAKTHFDLMCFEFACGDIAKGRLSLGQVLNHGSNAGSNDYASIDSAALEGYCQAFGVRPVNDADPIVAPVTEQTPAILAADNERKLLSMIGRHLIEKTTSSTQPSTLYIDVTSENVVRSYLALLGVTNRCLQYLTSIEAHLARFARVIAHQMTTLYSSSGNNRTITAAVVQYLCANVPGMDAALRSQLPSDQLQRSNIRIVDFVQRAIVLTPPPQPGAVAGLLSGGNDLWQLLLSYDSAEIKNLMLRIVPFVVPARFNVSMVLGEEVLTRVAAGPHQEYITVLMSKLEQLAKLGKIGAWQTTVNACGRELGPLGNDTKVQTTFTFEALRIEVRFGV
uniref:INTS8 TPR repeats domain-containing protein n=1 Tax=Plectus sambesii TaxID=2011161 RepID=A0A914XS12_9BILA